MENKLTDNEIKKDLETAIKIGDAPIGEHWGCMISKLTAKEALDLINRLEAEKSNLTSNLTSLQNDLTSAKAEVKRLKYLLEREEKATLSLSKQCYKDGAKEFAERLNKEAENAWIDNEDGFMFIYSDSDNTAKEIYYTLAEWCKEVADNILKEMEGEE